MKRVIAALAILGAVGLVAACANQTPRANTGGTAPVYTSPSPAPAPSGGGASCGGAGKA